jgi:hypothetical protein
MTLPRFERFRANAALCTLLFVGACASEGTKTGNGIRLEFAATQSPLTAIVDAGAATEPDGGPSRPAAQGTFRLESAWLNISEVTLRGPSSLCEGALAGSDVECADGRLRVRREMTLDLLDPRTSPLSEYVFPSTVYDRVDIRFDDDGATLGEVARASFVFSGTLERGGAKERVLITSRRNDELRFENTTGVDVFENEWLEAEIDVARWIAALPLSTCIDSGEVENVDGVWWFDDNTRCGDVPRLIFDELGASTRLDKD